MRARRSVATLRLFTPRPTRIVPEVIPVRAFVPNRVPPGMQNLRIRLIHRRASCEEVECRRMMLGWTEAPGGPFVGEREGGRAYHPPGTPCPMNGPTAPRGAPFHSVPDEAYQPLYAFEDSAGIERTITEGELKDRVGEGVHTIQHIRTRGL